MAVLCTISVSKKQCRASIRQLSPNDADFDARLFRDYRGGRQSLGQSNVDFVDSIKAIEDGVPHERSKSLDGPDLAFGTDFDYELSYRAVVDRVIHCVRFRSGFANRKGDIHHVAMTDNLLFIRHAVKGVKLDSFNEDACHRP